jgi:hypothetical protein
MANKIVDLTLVADYTPPPDPPESQAELSLEFSSYTVLENDQVTINILRSVRTDQVIDVDWAATNVSVTPISGTERFQIGESQKSVQLTALQVDTNEQGSFGLSNAVHISGPFSTPILISPSTAILNVNDTNPESYLPIAPNLFSFGSETSAGRGQHILFKVTNLNDSGAGSLRAALEDTRENRCVVFEVSGLIEIADDIDVTVGNLYVAGATAPDPGIFVYGRGGIILRSVDDVFIQHITAACSDLPGGADVGDRDVIRTQGNCNRIVIDHSTLLWGVDETASNWVHGSTTIQTQICWSHCIIAEGLYKNIINNNEIRGMGLIVGARAGDTDPINASVCYTLFAHCFERGPLSEDIYCANNVNYNFDFRASDIRGTSSGPGITIGDFENNIYKQGLNTNTSREPITLRDLAVGSSIWIDGNKCDWVVITNDEYTDYTVELRTNRDLVEASAVNNRPPNYNLLPTTLTYHYVIENVGSRPSNREFHGSRIVQDVQDGTGRLKESVENTGSSGDGESDPVPGGKPSMVSQNRSLTVPASYNAIQPSGYSRLEEWLQQYAHAVEVGLDFINTNPNETAHHTIALGATEFDGSAVQPGEIVEFESGARNLTSFRLYNLVGTVANPIIIRNDPLARQPAIFNHTGTNTFQFFRFDNCEHCILDGTKKYVGAPMGKLGVDSDGITLGRTQAGIKIVQIDANNPPTNYFQTEGSTQNVTIRGIELDGNNQAGKNNPSSRAGIGFAIHDRFSYQKGNQTDILQRQNILIENCYIHDTHHEGIYAGSNWNYGESQLDADLTNCEIRYCLFENTGWTGAQIKGDWDGSSSIHHCYSINCGDVAATDNDFGHSNGLQMDGCGDGAIYNNTIIDSGGWGLAVRNQYMESSIVEPCSYDVYNNVIVRAGTILGCAGILGWRPVVFTGLAALSIDTDNNTIVNPSTHCVSYERVNSGRVQDNILADSSQGVGDEFINNTSSVFSDTNNRTGTVTQQIFVSAGNDDYHLTSSSPAKDSGGSLGFPSTDRDDNSRPFGIQADQGAYEYVE